MSIGMSLGKIEIYVAIFLFLIAIAGVFITKNQGEKTKKLIQYLLFGMASSFLFVSFITPPDLISTFILFIPTFIILSIVIIRKSKDNNN